MAHLIIVHRHNKNDEMAVNADRIIFAERVELQSRPAAYTNLYLTDDKFIAITETLDELCGLCLSR